MSFLWSHNLPATACFVSRCLSSEPDGIAESDLRELLAPRLLDGPAGKKEDEAGGYATDHTIVALKSIGLLNVRESKLFVTATWRPALESAQSDREILQIVRRAVFASPKSRSTWKPPDQRGWDTSGANDFLRAACWFLAQDPLGPPFAFDRRGPAASAERLLQQQFKEGRPRLLNDTSWYDFARWACACGLARHTRLRDGVYLTPDPTDAIAEELTDSLELGVWYSVDEALGHLVERLPIVGKGVLRSQMIEHLQGVPEGVGGGTEDPTLSQAIIMLAEQRVLEFKALSDAVGQRLLWDQPTPQSITQLRLLEAY